MSESEVWRPDAEPWEALAEADRRSGTAGEYPMLDIWRDQAEALSGMGWALAPESDDELRAEVERLRAHVRRLEGQQEAAYWERVDDRREIERLRGALATAAEDLGKAVNQFAGLGYERNAAQFSAHERRALAAAASVGDDTGPEGEQAEHLRRAVALAERYGEAIARISAHLAEAEPSGPVNRVRLEIAALESPAPVPVPEEPEGEFRQRIEDEIRQWRRLPKRPERDSAIAAYRHVLSMLPAPVPVEEPDDEVEWSLDVLGIERDGTPAPEIKVGQVRRARIATDRSRDFNFTVCDPFDLAVAEDVLVTSEDETWRMDIERVLSAEVVSEPDPPAPSLNPEGLAWLDGEIERLAGSHRGRALLDEEKLMAYRQARERLVSAPSEEAENDE